MSEISNDCTHVIYKVYRVIFDSAAVNYHSRSFRWTIVFGKFRVLYIYLFMYNIMELFAVFVKSSCHGSSSQGRCIVYVTPSNFKHTKQIVFTPYPHLPSLNIMTNIEIIIVFDPAQFYLLKLTPFLPSSDHYSILSYRNYIHTYIYYKQRKTRDDCVQCLWNTTFL